MRKYAPTLPALLLLVSGAFGQGPNSKPAGNGAPVANAIPAAPAITATSTPMDLARAALAAQGGEKFKNLKSMMLFGSADLYAPNSTNSIPGKFYMVTAGDRVRIEIDARPLFNFKQIYDGEQSFSSLPGVQMPPRASSVCRC